MRVCGGREGGRPIYHNITSQRLVPRLPICKQKSMVGPATVGIDPTHFGILIIIFSAPISNSGKNTIIGLWEMLLFSIAKMSTIARMILQIYVWGITKHAVFKTCQHLKNHTTRTSNKNLDYYELRFKVQNYKRVLTFMRIL